MKNNYILSFNCFMAPKGGESGSRPDEIVFFNKKGIKYLSRGLLLGFSGSKLM